MTIITAVLRLQLSGGFCGIWHPFCNDAAGILSCSDQFSYTDTSNYTTFVVCRGEAGCPLPAVVEVLIMELSFELLREAGVRLPGAMGNTIGIVGGLIIGQAAVEANLVSPIVVIVISLLRYVLLQYRTKNLPQPSVS